MADEQINRWSVEDYLRFEDQRDEDRVREELVTLLETSYNEFFYPLEIAELERTGEKVLTSFDFHSGDRGTLSVLYQDSGLKAKIPYLDLDERFKLVMKRDLDPAFIKEINRRERGRLPDLPGLSERVSWYLGKEVFLYSSTFMLNLYYNGIQKSVERIGIAKDAGQNPIGEIWIGRKWRQDAAILSSKSGMAAS